jgi:hypothetical protein
MGSMDDTCPPIKKFAPKRGGRKRHACNTCGYLFSAITILFELKFIILFVFTGFPYSHIFQSTAIVLFGTLLAHLSQQQATIELPS